MRILLFVLTVLIPVFQFAQTDQLIKEVEKLTVSPEYKFIITILGVVIFALVGVIIYQDRSLKGILTTKDAQIKEVQDSKDELNSIILSITEKVVISSTGVQNVLEIIKENNHNAKLSIDKDHSEIKSTLINIKDIVKK